MISQRDLLRFIKKVGELPPVLCGKTLHEFGAVLGVGIKVVGVDGAKSDPFRKVFCGETRQLIHDVYDIGAVVADEHHAQGWSAAYIFQADRGAIYGVGQ